MANMTGASTKAGSAAQARTSLTKESKKDSQVPGFREGTKQISMNQLPSNASVVKSAKSNLMAGMSQNRGPGGNR